MIAGVGLALEVDLAVAARRAGSPRCVIGAAYGARQSGQLAHPRAPHAAGDAGARVLDQADRRADRRRDRRRGGPAARPRSRVDRRAPGARVRSASPRRSLLLPARAIARRAAGAAPPGRARACAACSPGSARPIRLALSSARAARDVVRVVRLRRGAARVHHLFRVAISRCELGYSLVTAGLVYACAHGAGHRRPDRVGRGRGPLARAAARRSRRSASISAVCALLAAAFSPALAARCGDRGRDAVRRVGGRLERRVPRGGGARRAGRARWRRDRRHPVLHLRAARCPARRSSPPRSGRPAATRGRFALFALALGGGRAAALARPVESAACPATRCCSSTACG